MGIRQPVVCRAKRDQQRDWLRNSPANRIYPGIVSDQTGQNYDTLIFGDVASPFAD
jgi:hypothetical protein